MGIGGSVLSILTDSTKYIPPLHLSLLSYRRISLLGMPMTPL